MSDREKVIAWLTEISLRPCDFTRDDFDETETERLANDAIEIVEDAEIFCKQRNGAIAMLKEQKERLGVLERTIEHMPKPVKLLDVFGDNYEKIVRCKNCKHATMTADGKMCKYCAMDTDDFGDQRDVYHDADFFCAYGEREGSK